MVAAAVVGSAVVGAAVSSDSSRRASNTLSDASDKASDVSQRQYDQTRADNAGYRARGNSAGDRLAMLLGLSPDGAASGAAADPLYGSLTKPFTGADLASEPGYQFGLKQGNDTIERSASARGGLYSGATLKALQRFGVDYGGTKFGEAFNRDRITKDALYNQLAGVSGTGQLATNQVSQAGQNFANNASGNIIGAGNAQAAGQIAQGNILTGALNQGVSSWQRARTGGGYGLNGSQGYFTQWGNDGGFGSGNGGMGD